MNALEPEPEQKGRTSRLLLGTFLALGIGGGVVFAADQVSPARRMLADVVKIAIVDQPPPPKPKQEEAPKPPPPTPPPTAPKVKPRNVPQPASTVPQPIKPNENAPEPVGLDVDSFGAGSGGPAFAVGTTQMGTPGEAARTVREVEEPEPPKPVLVEARPSPQNKKPPYTERARRLAIQGLMVIETDIDASGKVTRAVVRGKLEPMLDEAARLAVLDWRFSPATLDGKPVPSTKWLRVRFELE